MNTNTFWVWCYIVVWAKTLKFSERSIKHFLPKHPGYKWSENLSLGLSDYKILILYVRSKKKKCIDHRLYKICELWHLLLLHNGIDTHEFCWLARIHLPELYGHDWCYKVPNDSWQKKSASSNIFSHPFYCLSCGQDVYKGLYVCVSLGKGSQWGEMEIKDHLVGLV